MKKVLVILALFAFITSYATAEELVVAGYYQGENLYVLNPFDNDGESYCVTDVTVNGQEANAIINSSSFEIDLTNLDLKKGDSLTIIITHKDECEPQVVNKDVLKPVSTFTITSINVTKNGVLQWSTIEEQGRLPYIVEQYRWGTWVKLGYTEGEGSPRPHDYKFDLNSHPTIRPHSGKNRYRVKQVDHTGKPRYSLETNYVPEGVEKATIVDEKRKMGDEIVFTTKTSYRIYNSAGDIVKEGYAEKIDVAELSRGKYWLNYDNEIKKMKKR